MKATPRQIQKLLAQTGASESGPVRDAVVVYLSLPPSANALFLPTGNPKKPKVATPEYVAWQQAMSGVVKRLRPADPDGPFRIQLTLYGGEGLNLGRDADNMVKPTIDLLVSMGTIPGDSLRDGCWGSSTEYRPAAPGGHEKAKLAVQIFSVMASASDPGDVTTL